MEDAAEIALSLRFYYEDTQIDLPAGQSKLPGSNLSTKFQALF